MKRLDELGVSPAPWAYNTNKPAVYDSDGGCVADCDLHFDRRRDIADARLVAAAPDLYEALRLILASLDAIGFVPTVKEDALVRSFERGVRAIAKAGGEG